MQNCKWLSLIILIAFGCGKSIPEISGFDSNSFKNDRDGCKGSRIGAEEILRRDREKLLALTEMQIVKVLGKPDQNELYKRNQKFYSYFLEPSPSCVGDSTKSSKKLIVRFNAMGLSKEISIE